MKTSPIFTMLPVWRRLGLTAVLAVSLPGLMQAASYNSTWDGGGDGVSWSNAANWDTANYPKNGTDSYHAWIDHGAGNLVITTNETFALYGLTLNQAEGGTTTLKLGGDLSFANGTLSAGSGVNNTSGSAAGVVFDLNGYNLNTTGINAANHKFGEGSYTLKSSAANGGGVYSVRNIATGAVIDVQDKVTVRLTVATSSNFSLTTWSADSTVQIVNTGNHFGNANSAVRLGNLVVGDVANAAATVFSATGQNISVGGNVTLSTFTGATGGAASRLSFASSASTLRVAGDFTDYGTDNSSYSSGSTTTTGTLSFVGGISQEKTVSIGRTGLINHFRVGDTADAGNVRLARNLTTTGDVTVKDSSRLNVQSFTLQSGAFTAEAGATIGFELGGVINATTLTLNSFNLELLGNWSSYDISNDLLLFTYTSLVGTPSIESFIAPQGFNFDSIYASNGGVYLKMDVIPEPGTWALMGVSGLLILSRIRRRA